MIRHTTARRIMYDWHAGQWSPLYAAASSGLVESFVELADAAATITDADERGELMSWLQRQSSSAPRVAVDGREYRALPWVTL